MEPSREEVIEFFKDQQKQISNQIGNANKNDFLVKPWKGGVSGQSTGVGVVNYFDEGFFLEKGCINTTVIEGPILPSMNVLVKESQGNNESYNYMATGISIILHPKSPMIPSLHANLRYFEIYNQNKELVNSFFGGGIDLTPFYYFEEDFKHFHSTLKNACDRVDVELYPFLKAKADEYYFIAHRNEYRGIGGILNPRFVERPKDLVYKWVQESSQSILPAYLPIVERRINEPYTEAQRYWQLIRRGHYIEFNMHYDSGFKFLFSLNHQPTIENSFMSLPPYAAWQYDFKPLKGSKEEEMQEILLHPRDWV